MTAGAVLCGGASRRMGTDKALVEVDGIAMAVRVAAALEEAGCAPVVFVGGDAVLLARFDRPTIPDDWPGEGPLGGVLTALRALEDDTVVAACDLPFLDAVTVRAVIAGGDGFDVAVATTDRRQPAVAWWSRAALGPLMRSWDANVRALHEALGALRSAEVEVEPGAVRNVNSAADLAACRRSSVTTVGERSERTAGRASASEPHGDGVRGRSPREKTSVEEVDVDELAARVGAGARLIDVREPDEYTSGHVPGALSVPLATVPDRLELFRGDEPVLVICQGGGRSRRAAEFVAEHDIEAVNVAGGTGAWIASGRETVAGDLPQ